MIEMTKTSHHRERTSVMARWFSSLSHRERLDSFARLRDALNDLLDLKLESSWRDDLSWQGAVERLSCDLLAGIHNPGYAFGVSETLALVAALADVRTGPVENLVNDLAEILFLKREERTEYAESRQKTPPFKIAKILLEYATKTKEVDRLVTRLNKGFCAHHCPEPPTGCCHILGYDMGLTPDRMLAMQKLEAERRGWRPPSHPDLKKCRYHSDAGCQLALFKSPACIGYLCPGIEADLKARFKENDLENFYSKLKAFRNCDIDRRDVFSALDALIAAGNRLL